MVEISDIDKKSIAAKLGIKVGSILISINQRPVNDALDYRFYQSGEELEVLIEQDGEQILFEIEKDDQEDLGLVLEDLKMRKCGTKCVFCFVHQNPKGLRKTIYFKDEDYRFSFLYGHYVTLSNARQADLDRIVEQRLTPLYVSVHATDRELRQYLLGIKYDDRLLDKIEYLTRHGIELNCQIVLCPELNDGMQLLKTINDMKKFYPGIRSIAIVPVGLTKHRRNLPVLIPVTEKYSLNLMKWTDHQRQKLKKELRSSFIYLSDEFYIRTGINIPDNNYYEGFYQLENGVGLTRDMITHFDEELSRIPALTRKASLTLVSAKLGASVLKKYFIPKLHKISGLEIKVYQVPNHFYGPSIVVSGLLVGRDIYNHLKNKNLGDYIVLPPRVLNHDGLFLDDWTVEQLEDKLQRPVFIFPDSFLKLFQNIKYNSKLNDVEARKTRHAGPSLYVAEHLKGDESLFEVALED
jgi:putative radical SAM enzyme (TIGR03279 family)